MEKRGLVLYAVTDRAWLSEGETLPQQVEKAILGGVGLVQLREKKLKGEELEKLAIEVRDVCRLHKIPFIVNDDVKLAARIDADGVHVGQSDMDVEKARAILGPDKIIGATAKTIKQAKKAQKAGADYLGSGAVFGSSTKTDAIPMDLSLFTEICNSVDIPVFAIGGITGENIEKLSGTPLAGAAVVSGIFAAEDVEAAARDLKAKLDNFEKGKQGVTL